MLEIKNAFKEIHPQRLEEIETLAKFPGDLNSKAIKELLEEREVLLLKIDLLLTAKSVIMSERYK